MNCLIKPKFESGAMRQFKMDEPTLLRIIAQPKVRPDKHAIPLFTFAKPRFPYVPAKDDPDSMRAAAENIISYDCIQVDYDDGYSIEEFQKRFGRIRYYLYTSYNHGFRDSDRFRVIIPLASPLDQDWMGRGFKAYMHDVFGDCDDSCFDRCHFQAIPAMREDGVDKYYHYVNDVSTLFDCDRETIEQYDAKLRRYQYQCGMFEEARAAMREELYGSLMDSEEMRITNQLTFAQSLLDTAVMGNRHNACFDTLCYLQRKGLLDHAWTLMPPPEANEEWEKCRKQFCC